MQSVHREAAGYFEQALGTIQYLPETRDIREQAVDLRRVFPPNLDVIFPAIPLEIHELLQ